MKREDNNLSQSGPDSQLDKNISRLVKRADDSDKPGKAFTASLIQNALGELEKLKKEKKRKTMYAGRWEKTLGWAAMFIAGCGAVIAVAASALLKINFLLEAVAILTVSLSWLMYLGEHTL